MTNDFIHNNSIMTLGGGIESPNAIKTRNFGVEVRNSLTPLHPTPSPAAITPKIFTQNVKNGN